MEIIIILVLAVLLGISVITSVLFFKASINQQNKIALYEKWITEDDTWITEVKNSVTSTYLKMKVVDDKQLFMKDDDVGVAFQELLSLLKKLNDKIQELTPSYETKETPAKET